MFKKIKKTLDRMLKISDNTQTVNKPLEGKNMSNYTPELTAALESRGSWTYAEAVAFAEENALKPRSVIAKIKSLGLEYTPKPTRVTKQGEPVVRKSQFVAAIEAAVGVSVPSLAKATKQDLETLTRAVGAEMPEAN